MTDSPIVSILIPCYNAEQYLAECLESALAQTYQGIEIIVVDDGSTDSSVEIARGFEGRGVRIVRQKNGGQSAALNTAFRASRGEYIQYLDADDVLHPGKIDAQLARLKSAPTAIASAAWARFQSRLDEANFASEEVWQDLAPVDWVVKSWKGGGMMHVAGWLIPRSIVLAAGPWDESLRWASNLDGHFFTRTLLASSRCLFCPEAKSYYRSGHASMSSWRSRKSVEATFRVLLDIGNALLKSEDSERTRRAFADNLQRFIFANYPENQDLVLAAETKVKELGGSDLPLSAGPVQAALSKVVGWKMGKRVHRLGHSVKRGLGRA